MLHLVSKAIVELLWPLTWSGIYIPVLPARLIQALEAPCPYIVGIERRYEKVELPEDEFVLVDLDQDEIESTVRPIQMPKQQRRKLSSILQLAAPHHNQFGVPKGPPAYAIEAFPFNTFSSEIPAIFTSSPHPTAIAKYIGAESNKFGDNESNIPTKSLVFNAFQPPRDDKNGFHRPSTSSTSKHSSPPSSPTSGSAPPTPFAPHNRNDSGLAIQSSLREKRSGHFDSSSKRSSTYHPMRRPSIPFSNHSSQPSISRTVSNYAPSVYAQSTLAASTIMPGMLHQPVHNTDTTAWIEGHCLQWRFKDDKSICTLCDERAEDGIYRCNGCGINAHARCAQQICIICPTAFHPEQIRAAFARCFAALFYTYRKFLQAPNKDQKKAGQLYSFNVEGFYRSLPHENADYMQVLQQTQCKWIDAPRKFILTPSAFNQFIHEREMKAANDPEIMLFDQMILSKRNRGRASMFSKSKTDFLSDSSDHLWRLASATPPKGPIPGDYRSIITRSKCDRSLHCSLGRKY